MSQVPYILMSTPSSAIALVTGASSGIGAATARRLAARGYEIWIHYNSNQGKAEKVLEEIRDGGGQGLLWQADLGRPEEIEERIESFWKEHGSRSVEVLVNNAGIHEDTLAGLMSLESFDRVVRTNLHGPFVLLKWAARKMMRARKGAIVNVASLAGQTGNPGQINYAASKAGLIAMTKTLAMELGPRNVRVNAVAPGLIETEMIQNIPQLEDFKKRIPMGRFGTADEVAACIDFLCSPAASYVTGHTLSINGGLFPT